LSITLRVKSQILISKPWTNSNDPNPNFKTEALGDLDLDIVWDSDSRGKGTPAPLTGQSCLTAALPEDRIALLTAPGSYESNPPTLLHRNVPDNPRADFVGVELDENGKAKRVALIENAVS